MFSNESVQQTHSVESERTRIRRLVIDYASVEKADVKQVWRFLYSTLNDSFRFNVSHYKLATDKTYLDRADRRGHLTNLLEIAFTYLSPVVTKALR